MGRGLSDLQKTILQLAYENHVSEGRALPQYRVLVDVEKPPLPERPPLPEDPMEALRAAFHTDDTAYWLAYGEIQHQAWEAAASPLRDLLPEKLTIDGGSNAIIAGVFATEALARPHAEGLTARGASARVKGIYEDWADLYTHEVLIAAFGFDQYRKVHIDGRPAPLRIYKEQIRAPVGRFFDRSAIGEGQYNTAVVSVSRAFARLEERGLVVRLYAGYEWMGIQLTPEGFEVAASLSANTHDNVTTLSQ